MGKKLSLRKWINDYTKILQIQKAQIVLRRFAINESVFLSLQHSIIEDFENDHNPISE